MNKRFSSLHIQTTHLNFTNSYVDRLDTLTLSKAHITANIVWDRSGNEPDDAVYFNGNLIGTSEEVNKATKAFKKVYKANQNPTAQFTTGDTVFLTDLKRVDIAPKDNEHPYPYSTNGTYKDNLSTEQLLDKCMPKLIEFFKTATFNLKLDPVFSTSVNKSL